MKYPSWLPFIGWRDITEEDCLELGLQVHWRWQMLCVEWFWP
jgi:hypothetical protein